MELLLWNCEHEVWDDFDGDDSCCDKFDVEYWQLLHRP
jgi:hypothetical protein